MSYERPKTRHLEAETLALRALAWIIGDPALGPRLLALTGLDVATLRAQAGSPVLLTAALAFLESHEPSLLACGRALDVKPEELVAANRLITG